jgi:hypothetical protein
VLWPYALGISCDSDAPKEQNRTDRIPAFKEQFPDVNPQEWKNFSAHDRTEKLASVIVFYKF